MRRGAAKLGRPGDEAALWRRFGGNLSIGLVGGGPGPSAIAGRLRVQTDRLLSGDGTPSWDALIERRDRMHARAMTLLDEALRVVSASGATSGRP